MFGNSVYISPSYSHGSSFFLAKCCNCIASSAIAIRCRLSSVCLHLSVRRLRCECIMTKRLKLGSYSFHWNVDQCLNSLSAKFDYEIRRGSLDRGLKQKWGGFWLRDAISRRLCEIELRWRLITNKKSIATKVEDLEWPWTSIHCSVIRVMHVLTKRLRLESSGLRYKVCLLYTSPSPRD